MPRRDTFKQIYLALTLTMLGLKWLLVVFLFLTRLTATEVPPLVEIRILVPTAALLLGARGAARGGCMDVHRSTGLTLTLVVLGLGYVLAIVDAFGLPVLLDPIAAVTADPLAMLSPAALWSFQTVTAWLFGAWMVGALFRPRPGLDHD